MTIRMTETGLSEINEATTVYTDSVKRGYSDCTMRITYAATLAADAQMGDKDNPNTVTLTWKRTNTTYYDTLEDCCHIYTYGVDILKQFSDGKGNIQNVKFNLHNDTDNCYIIADLKDGVYYAKGIASKKADATTFIPNGSGHIIVKGLEDDSYSLTETATDKGYVLLKEAVKIIITTKENNACEKCGAKLLTASATVNGKDVSMTDGNAILPLTVVNNPGFDLPKTGGQLALVIADDSHRVCKGVNSSNRAAHRLLQGFQVVVNLDLLRMLSRCNFQHRKGIFILFHYHSP